MREPTDSPATSIRPRLFQTLAPAYWRIGSASQWGNFLQMFKGMASPPTAIIIPTKSVIGFGPGATLTSIDTMGSLAANCGTIYDSLTNGRLNPLPAGTYIDCANELDQASNWNDSAANAGRAISRIAGNFKGFQSNLKIMAGSFSKYDTSWITPMMNQMLPDGNNIDSLSWHAEGSATTPSNAASDVGPADTAYRLSGTWNAIGANTMKLCVNEYGSQKNEQWLSPAFILAYLVAFDTNSPVLDIACRTCWGDALTPNGCFDEVSMARMLSPNGYCIPNGVYELMRRYAESQGCRVAVSQSDATVATLAYSLPNSARVTVFLGPYHAVPGGSAAANAITLNGLTGPLGTGASVQCRTTLLDKYPIGLPAAQSVVGVSTVSSGSVSFNVPAIKYGQALAVDVSLPEPSQVATLHGTRRKL